MDLLDNLLKRKGLAVLLLLLLGSMILFTGIGAFSLTEVDEARFAEVAREMLVRQEFLSPYFNYAPYFNKPPLYMWLTAATYSLLGISEATARLWSALFGLGTMLIVFAMGGLLFNRRIGFIAALILITGLQWTAESRLGLLNIGVSFFITLSLLALLLAVKRERLQYYLLFFLSMGLGVLMKGPIAIIFPGLIGLLYLIYAQRLRDLVSPWAIAGACLMLAVALPWHIVQWQRFGHDFLGTYFGYHMMERYTCSIEGHGEPQYYYLLVLALGMLPWSGFMPGALAVSGRLWRKHREGILFLLLWFVCIYAFFAVGKTKLPGYITPLYPSLSLFLAAFIGSREGQGRWLRVSYLSLFILGLLLLVAVPALQQRIQPEYHFYIRFIFYMGITSTAGGLAGWLLLRLARRMDIAIAFGTLVAVVMVGVLHLGALPVWDINKPTRPLSRIAATIMESDDGIASYKLGENSSPFYMRRHVRLFDTPDQLSSWLSSSDTRYAMLPEAKLAEVETRSGRKFRVVDSYREYLLIINRAKGRQKTEN
ncbi:MAG: glycosyltransferase family 39 protein [bacterium]|jgi:4-amino-4-deoxy-L-arabinose transferase-like glycosyltransferase|nr:glycosyltransferase family 39 protein [bacterium]MDD4558067.1 glycosyltransferase family 39 protein [bacterium]